MPLVPVEFSVGDRDYCYSPLFLTPSRSLWDFLVKKYGNVISASLEAIKNPENLSQEQEVGLFFGEALRSVGSALREFVYSHDNESHVLLWKTLCPQLQFRNDLGNFIPLTNAIAEDLFATHLSWELQIIMNCLKVQYADFFERLSKLSSTIDQVKAAIKSSNLPKG